MLYCLNVGEEYSKEGIDKYCSILDTDDWVAECMHFEKIIDYIETNKLSVSNIIKSEFKKGVYYVKVIKLLKWGYNELTPDLIVVISSSYIAVWRNDKLTILELNRAISEKNIMYSYIVKKSKHDNSININIRLDIGSISVCVGEDGCIKDIGLKNKKGIYCKKEDIKKMLLFR